MPRYRKLKNQTRNLNPHRAAKAAMWLYGKDYANQGGGSMDFWDRLPKHRKQTSIRMIKELEKTRPYTGGIPIEG
jgi:hypothetical protein